MVKKRSWVRFPSWAFPLPGSRQSTQDHSTSLPAPRLSEGWLLDGEIAQHSPQTLAIRRFLLGKLSWFLSARGCGRWGRANLTRPVRPSTVRTHWLHLCAFFSWPVGEGVLEASRRSLHPRCDGAILLMLLDTGLRASELCSVRSCDLDVRARHLSVQGKGGRRRSGDGLTRSGLGQLLERLGKAAGVEAVRVSPHTCRHTFALRFLRAGGNVFGL